MARGTFEKNRSSTTTGAGAPKIFVKPFFRAQKNPPKRVQVGMIFAYQEITR